MRERRVLQGQVDLLYRQLPSGLIASCVNATLLVAAMWTRIPWPALVVWECSILGLSLARLNLLRAYRSSGPDHSGTSVWLRRFLLGVGLHGVLWGAAGASFLVQQSQIHHFMLVFVLAGMCAGSVATLSSVRYAYPAFVLPALLPYVARLLANRDQVHLVMGAMVLLFIAMMWMISRRVHVLVTESLRLRLANLDLIDDLTRARDRQEVAHQALGVEIEARREAQEALQRSHDELERRVQERTGELAQANARLILERELFRTTLASIGDGVITVDSNRHITYLNPAAEHYTGWRMGDAEGSHVDDVLQVARAQPQVEQVESLGAQIPVQGESEPDHLLMVDREGRERYIDRSETPIRSPFGDPIGTVLTFRDISKELKLRQRLSYQATHDALTGLTTHDELKQRLTRVVKSVGPGDSHALIYIDLDQFKIVNDSCGHLAGDELLRQIAALLSTRIRTRDTFARLGGDEFAVLLEHCPVDEALEIARTLRELAEGMRFAWEDRTFTVSLSIGLVPITEAWESASSLLQAADSACYTAKDLGRNRIQMYEPADRAAGARSRETQWRPRIEQALAQGRLRLYLQPIIPIGSTNGGLELGEALLRLVDEGDAVVPPGAFLPAAERYGYMDAIDRWVVAETLAALGGGGAQNRRRAFINLSGQSLTAEDFLEFLVERIKASAAEPSRLCFEIEESTMISHYTDLRSFIASVGALGCRFALDDFGSGLSSFGYLKGLPIEYLKIDGRVIREMPAHPFAAAKVEVVNHLGHVLGLRTIAKWVESDEALERLKAMKVDYAQGFHVGRPRPMELWLDDSGG